MAKTDLTLKVKKLDEITTSARAVVAGIGSAESDSFESAIQMADAMNSLRSAIDDDILDKIVALQDSPLGFRTDRDPKQTDYNTGRPHIAYPKEVVKECFIESALRGLKPIGNMWNIISGRPYTTKEGYRYLLKTLPGFTDYRPGFGIPKMQEGGAITKCAATWKLKGVEDSLECEIPVRVNAKMGADAILGKLERKLAKRVHDRITGTEIPDGEVDEPVDMLHAPSTSSAVKEPGKDLKGPEDLDAKSAPNKPHALIMSWMDANGVSEDQVLGQLKTVKLIDNNIIELFQLPDAKLKEIFARLPSMLAEIREVVI